MPVVKWSIFPLRRFIPEYTRYMLKIPAHKLVGWSLVATFVLLTGGMIAGHIGEAPKSHWVLIPGVALTTGFILLPALMVLKRRWEDITIVLSGGFCLILFLVLTSNVAKVTDWMGEPGVEHSWRPFAALVIVICCWVLPFKLHRILLPRLHRLLARGKADVGELR